MGLRLLASTLLVWLAACVTTPEQIAESEILETWEQFETFYNAGDLEGVKSLLFIEGLSADDQAQVEAEIDEMSGETNWMMSPNVGMTLDADVKVETVEGDRALLVGTLKQMGGQAVYFSMPFLRVDGTWLIAPASGAVGSAT